MTFHKAQSILLVLVLVIGLLSSCKNSPPPADAEGGSTIAFTDGDGNTLTKEELESATGTFNYEMYGAETVNKKARDLFNEGRKYGMTGAYENGLERLNQAHAEAPEWPYPLYEMAYTYLLMDDYENALRYYELTNNLAPRGFFTCKTALHTLKREEKGVFPRGLYKSYLSLEFIQDNGQKEELFENLTSQYPDFAPGWKQYSSLLEGADRLKAIEKGLSLQPDIETKGSLLINKALATDLSGDSQKAADILTRLIFDPNSTLANVELAKFVLNTINVEGQ